MHVGDSPKSVDLSPNTTAGVLFDGMSGDGSRSSSPPPTNFGGRHRRQRRHLPRRRRRAGAATLTWSRPASTAPATRRLRRPELQNWNVVAGGRRLRRRRHRRRRRRRGRRRAASTSSAPSCSTAPATAKPDSPNLYVVRAGLRARISSARSTPALTEPGRAARRSTRSTTASAPGRLRIRRPDARGRPTNGDVYIADNGSRSSASSTPAAT